MQFDIITNVAVFKKWVMFLLTNINSLIKTIGILDVIDILVVAYFLFRIYLMLKNTRAAVLVKGLLTLGAIMFISRWLNLHVISWVLEKSMTVLIVALPIVFQPELRRALEQIGRGRLFRKHGELDEYEVDEMVNSITSAAIVMGRRKIGALIVIEREIGLEERIETGVAIDGLISDSLLLNIFEKDTPLHDGAVIIRGNRIAAASCLLPLTEMRNLSQELGTRHRAALGISEQSDAVILVVSEETGTISLARNGTLQRYLTADDVKEFLKASITRPKDDFKQMLREKIRDLRGDKK